MARDSEHTAPESRGHHDLFPPRLPVNLREYLSFFRKTAARRNEFWSAQAERLVWDRPFTAADTSDFAEGRISWFEDGMLNACRNVLETRRGDAGKPALIFLDGAGGVQSYMRGELEREARRFAAALAGTGLKHGDRAAFYLPDAPETVFLTLACTFLGIVPVPIPTRYTAELTRAILADSGASLLAVGFGSGPEHYEDRARSVVQSANGIAVVNMGSRGVEGTISREDFVPSGIEPLETGVSVAAEHPFFILYSNSAAGIPRGSVFATGGFLVQAAASCDYFLGAMAGETEDGIVCTLDLASAAGQCYGFWGPLLNGVTTVLIAEEGRSSAERLRQALELAGTPVLLTSPVILSSLKRELGGAALSERRFRLLAASGDTLTPRHIQFAADALVSSPERTLNLWVQTECGAALIGTRPSSELNRPGALGLPFPGVAPAVFDSHGQESRPNESGQLVFRSSWPAMIRTIRGQDERYRQLYFGRVPGYYSTNDGVRVDGQGFYWFMGRLDDVIKVRGQSLSTAEVEAVLTAHPRVAEAAVVGVENEEGEGETVAFLVLDAPPENRDDLHTLESELSRSIENRVGEFALLSRYITTPALPRTRAGKIARRVLRRIVTGDITMDEDLSHLANPGSVEKLIRERGL